MRMIGGGIYNGSQTRSVVGLWAVVGGGITMKIHSAFNLSSLTDNGTGDFTLTMSIPFASASDYAVVATQGSGNFSAAHIDHSNPPTASTVRVVTFDDSVANVGDRDPVTIVAAGRR